MEQLISVIVPVYNVQEYLYECLHSLEKQTHKNCQFILIDNGSTDDSAKIAQKFCEKDPRFILYKIDKMGASIARNFGLDHAEGHYIAFVDSDDWVEEDYLETMLRAMLNDSSDMAVCDFYTGETVTGNWLATTISACVGGILNEYFSEGIKNRVYNKLFSRELIGNSRFPEGRDLMEDGVFTAKIIVKARQVTRVAKALYHYRIRSDSLMRKSRSHSEKCGYYANAFERILIFANVPIDDEIAGNLLKQFKDNLYSAIEAGIDLNKFSIFSYIKTCAEKLSIYFSADAMINICQNVESSKALVRRVYAYRTKNSKSTKEKIHVDALRVSSALKKLYYIAQR